MKRVRWLKVDWPVSMQKLGERMKAQLFTPNSQEGFVVERVTEDLVEGCFIEKLTIQEVTTDPFGNEMESERVVYRSVDFTLFENHPQIELRTPPRSTKEFIQKLSELCDAELEVEPLTLQLMDWVRTLQGNLKHNLVVDAIQISGLELEQGITAKILLKSERDVREAMQNLIGKSKFMPEKVQLKITMGANKTVPLHLANTGTVNITSDYYTYLLPILRKTLPQKFEL